MILLIVIVVLWLYFRPYFDWDKDNEVLFIHYWWGNSRKVYILQL